MQKKKVKLFWLHQKYGFTIEAKTKSILEGDEALPNRSLVFNLGSVSTTPPRPTQKKEKGNIGMALEKHNVIVLA